MALQHGWERATQTGWGYAAARASTGSPGADGSAFMCSCNPAPRPGGGGAPSASRARASSHSHQRESPVQVQSLIRSSWCRETPGRTSFELGTYWTWQIDSKQQARPPLSPRAFRLGLGVRHRTKGPFFVLYFCPAPQSCLGSFFLSL